MTLRTGNKEGFTLLEVIVAVSILAIGLVGVLRAYATSASAMEKVQYEMDGVFLLKTAMGKIEEKAVTQGILLPGVSSGEFTSAEEESLGLKSAGLWRWSQEVQKMDLPTKKAKQDPANKETRPDEKKKPEFYLNKLKLAVVNSGRIPPREISLETYVGTDRAKSS
ncbi:MAG: type II secretion system protein [Candidatus Omnitrophota bacterium]